MMPSQKSGLSPIWSKFRNHRWVSELFTEASGMFFYSHLDTKRFIPSITFIFIGKTSWGPSVGEELTTSLTI